LDVLCGAMEHGSRTTLSHSVTVMKQNMLHGSSSYSSATLSPFALFSHCFGPQRLSQRQIQSRLRRLRFRFISFSTHFLKFVIAPGQCRSCRGLGCSSWPPALPSFHFPSQCRLLGDRRTGTRARQCRSRSGPSPTPSTPVSVRSGREGYR